MATTTLPSSDSKSKVRIRPLTPSIGAEVEGVDLNAPLDEGVARAIQEAFYTYKVIFFRDANVSPARMTELAVHFGGVAERDTYNTTGDKQEPASGIRALQQLVKGEHAQRPLDNEWHSDSMFWPEPPRGAMLRSIEVPDVGGDTMWADMVAAYASLPADMQAFLRPLYAINDARISASRFSGSDGEKLNAIMAKNPPMRHPLIRRHPVTGELAIYASEPNTSHIEGMDRKESDALLAQLFALARTPEFQVRFKWTAGALAIWDNRVTQHYAVFDYYPQRRVMERIFLREDKVLPAD